jgi:hypothetical protein
MNDTTINFTQDRGQEQGLTKLAHISTLLFIHWQFNHSNVRMPETLERVIRWLVVTPHSILCRETDSNFGLTFLGGTGSFALIAPSPKLVMTG